MKFLKTIITLILLNFFLLQALVISFNHFSQPKIELADANKATVENQVKSPVSTLTPTLPVLSPIPTEKNSKSIVRDTPTIQPTPAVDLSRCIIIIDGKKYDVTEFRKIHSGGDVFKCGTDMTSDFYARHDASYLTPMEKYKIQ